MNIHRWLLIALMLMGVFTLAQGAGAVSSTHYRLDWFAPMTGTGGTAQSAHYGAMVTVGQTAPGAASSAHYVAGLGYWYGAGNGAALYLPMIAH